MDPEKKKQLKKDYKSKLAVGAVYCVECSGDQSRIIKSTVDIGGIKSRFEFACKTESCPDPAIYNEWSKYGSKSFSLTVLEELEQKESQTGREFAEDIKLLQEMWLEKAMSGKEK